MKKILFAIFLIVFYIEILNKKSNDKTAAVSKSGPVMMTNSFGFSLRLKKLPIVYDFDKSVPKSQYKVFQKAADRMNKDLGVEAIKLSYKVTNRGEESYEIQDGANTIYWFTSKYNPVSTLKIDDGCETLAYATVPHSFAKITESDLFFDARRFATHNKDAIIRHEMAHSLGFDHDDSSYHNLMTTYLDAGVSKNNLSKRQVAEFKRVYKLQSKDTLASTDK